jgi:hypothetical protein
MPTTSAAINQDDSSDGITLASGPKKRGRPAKTKVKATKKPLPKVKLPPNPFQTEILDLVSKQRTKAKKIDVLQEHRNDALVSLLIWNFDDTCFSALPEGPVPYKPNDAPAGTEHTSLRQEVRHFYNFIQGGNPSLSKTRRENIFIQILETLHPDEAQLLVSVKDKCLEEYYNLTQEVVAEAYPDITWGGRGGQKYEG